jgi:Na+/H+ antiporter NhaA
MSLFIAALAYSGTEQLPLAKTGVLLASVVAGSVGYAILRSISARASSE